MTEQKAVLIVHQAFYDAFASGDMLAMEQIWAHDRAVFCTHPGGPALVGRDSVMASWRSILADPPPVRIDMPRVAIYGETALLLCRESVGDARLAATNVLIRTDEGWRMVHHHAGPIARTGSADQAATMH